VKFSDIPGLTSLKTSLIDSVKERHVAHAQLFLGKPGTLNLPLALAYATYLHCTNPGADDACGACAACSKSLKYIHPDTTFVFPMAGKKSSKDKDADEGTDNDDDGQKAEMMKTWRAFLLERPLGNLDQWITYYDGADKQAFISRETSREIIKSLALKPFESAFKVMIIWQPELMHPAAANGILKILEEPPPNTVFLLVSNASEKLLPTVLSRTQVIQVPYLADDELRQLLLQSNDSLRESRVKEIVQLADGNADVALQLSETDDIQHLTDYQNYVADWMRSCYKRDYTTLVSYAEQFHDLDKMEQRNLFYFSLNIMRESLVQLAGATALSRVDSTQYPFAKDFSRIISVKKLERINQLINNASYHLERNGSPKMIFLDLSLQISKCINP
jgi:DNA polymerase III subunit delta'